MTALSPLDPAPIDSDGEAFLPTLATLKDAVLPRSLLAKLCNRPYFATHAVQHGGMYIRVKHGDEYRLGRVCAVDRTDQPYPLRTSKGQYTDAMLVIDTVPVPVRMDVVSSHPPLLQEFGAYAEKKEIRGAERKALVDQLPDVGRAVRALMAYAPNIEELKAIKDINTRLGNAVNVVSELAAVQRQQSVLESQADDDLLEQSPLAQPTAEGSMLDMSLQTQTFGRLTQASMSGGDHSASRTLSLANKFASFVSAEQRSREGQHLSALTHRNQHLNTITTLRAAENFKTYVRKGKFEESKLLWEVDDEQRARLCREYDDIKEGRAKPEDFTPGIKAPEASTQKVQTDRSDPSQLVPSAVEAFKNRSGDLSQLDDDVLAGLDAPLPPIPLIGGKRPRPATA